MLGLNIDLRRGRPQRLNLHNRLLEQLLPLAVPPYYRISDHPADTGLLVGFTH